MGAEQPSIYYDRLFSKSKEYRKMPEHSIYYEGWEQIVKWVGSGSIFEIGCGSGQLAKMLLNQNKNYIKGIDFSNKAIELAKKNNPNYTDNFEVKDLFNITKIKFCNTIICTEVLEHIDNDKHVVNILENWQRFIFSVPDFIVESHVRCFKSIDEIMERYNNLNILDYKKFKVANNKHIYLVESIKA